MALRLLLRRTVADMTGRMVDPVRVVEPVHGRVGGEQLLVGPLEELHVLAVDALAQEAVLDGHLLGAAARRERHGGVEGALVVQLVESPTGRKCCRFYFAGWF